MFPFSWQDEFVITSPLTTDLNISEAAKKLAVSIEREAPKKINQTNNSVSFRTGLFRMASGWNKLSHDEENSGDPVKAKITKSFVQRYGAKYIEDHTQQCN